MAEEAEVDEPVSVAAWRRQVLPHVPAAPPSTANKQNAVAVQCYKCGGPNHFARDCQQPRANHEERSQRYAVISVNNKDKCIQRATSAYIDDVYVDESIVPVAHVKEHLCSFGLLSKEPERLQDGVQVLGLQI